MNSKTGHRKRHREPFVMCPIALLQVKHKDLSPHALKLWLVLKGHCIHTEIAFPGIARLAKILGTSRQTVLDLTCELESKNLLEVTRKKGTVNQYLLKTPADSEACQETLPTSQVELTSQAELTSQVPNWSSAVDGTSQAELTLNRSTQIEEYRQTAIQPSADASSSDSEEKDSKNGKKPKKPSDPRVKQLIDQFSARHLEKFGHKYTVSGARDGQNLKDLLKDHAPEIITACMDLFFADTDEWLGGKRTIPVFRSRINTCLQQLNKNTAVPAHAAHRRLE